MIKTLRIKVALELDSGNGEELSKFSSQFEKKKKKREKTLSFTSYKNDFFFFFSKESDWKVHFLGKKKLPKVTQNLSNKIFRMFCKFTFR